MKADNGQTYAILGDKFPTIAPVWAAESNVDIEYFKFNWRFSTIAPVQAAESHYTENLLIMMHEFEFSTIAPVQAAEV